MKDVDLPVTYGEFRYLRKVLAPDEVAETRLQLSPLPLLTVIRTTNRVLIYRGRKTPAPPVEAWPLGLLKVEDIAFKREVDRMGETYTLVLPRPPGSTVHEPVTLVAYGATGTDFERILDACFQVLIGPAESARAVEVVRNRLELEEAAERAKEEAVEELLHPELDDIHWNEANYRSATGVRADVDSAIARLHHTAAVKTRKGQLASRLEAGEYVQAISKCEAEEGLGLVALTNRRVVVLLWNIIRRNDWSWRLGDIREVRTTLRDDELVLSIDVSILRTGRVAGMEVGALPHDDGEYFVGLLRSAVSRGSWEPDQAPLAAMELPSPVSSGPRLLVRIYPDRIEQDSWKVSPGRVATAVAGSVLLGDAALVGVQAAHLAGLRGARSAKTIWFSELTSFDAKPLKSGFKVTILGSGQKLAFECPHEFLAILRQHAMPPSSGQAEAPQGGSSLASDLARLADLRSRGLLTEDEFAEAKNKLLN